MEAIMDNHPSQTYLAGAKKLRELVHKILGLDPKNIDDKVSENVQVGLSKTQNSKAFAYRIAVAKPFMEEKLRNYFTNGTYSIKEDEQYPIKYEQFHKE